MKIGMTVQLLQSQINFFTVQTMISFTHKQAIIVEK